MTQPMMRLLFCHGLRVKPVVYFYDEQGPPPQEMVQWQDEWLKSVALCRSTTIAFKAGSQTETRTETETETSLVCWFGCMGQVPARVHGKTRVGSSICLAL